jgi:hypothetical protein
MTYNSDKTRNKPQSKTSASLPTTKQLPWWPEVARGPRRSARDSSTNKHLTENCQPPAGPIKSTPTRRKEPSHGRIEERSA